MKYKFCSFRINVTQYDVTFAKMGYYIVNRGFRSCLGSFYKQWLQNFPIKWVPIYRIVNEANYFNSGMPPLTINSEMVVNEAKVLS